MLKKTEIICTICPLGCRIVVTSKGGEIEKIEYFSCKRGEEFAKTEFKDPRRVLTSTAKVEGADVPLVPVRSNKPIPKGLQFECIEEIRKLRVKAPIKIYDVLISNILETGVDIVATSNVVEE